MKNQEPVPQDVDKNADEDEVYQEVKESEKIPVTIVSGFLGAGKTTLVNHILKGDHGMKIAVVENEFGEVSIDNDLVSENLKAAESIVTMDNGCVCCTVRGDLIRALTQLLENETKFDAVLVETTGLADPAPVAFTFYMNPDINENYKIDSILTLVDSKHIKVHLEEEKPEGAVNEAVQQVAFADRILLNKTDLVSADELSEIKSVIKSINGFAEVIECQQSKVPLSKILGVNSFSIEKTLEVDPDFLLDDEIEADVPGDDDQQASKRRRKKKVHDLSGVGSVGITLEGDLDDVVFNAFMQQLLQSKARDLYRSKGVLSIHGQGNIKFVFQGVHEQINFGPSQSIWEEDEKRINKLVFIGRGLNRKELEESFRGCLYVPLPEGWETSMDDYGRRYYFHSESRKTQWTRPTA
mmetsp:Transcript_28663/g.39589  ORF Transcript_28663/g.39589 Transcript_28663/m.39589 type:complete len:411 (+) Transcript_28663:192-1424(+)|eukprot:CAMPEP_0196586606 /NCGR_PEP_ID=MMETSP1081-20130531/54921_1 /TAXON_ID=36882 /ORGANISM="Pyramimonas amylifera, Strain CCMP720" /LENGTH=410 /DNA_ID=CAMNT_0041908543 /DNA_START=190 /DNA_END=1422 /DNA_ORIENTATION=-